MNQYTAVIKQQADCWIGWIEEIPGVNCQEPTREALLETLKATLEEAIEMNRVDALNAVPGVHEKEIVSL
ncbi:MAG: type II toxin-antitoxin system HicB family antitoxin [Candidatus Hydrogenedens sp.]|nr:type II toxin-antitoxin system HicB family antitoxin [Candidatus Hydrogenedens sp.]